VSTKSLFVADSNKANGVVLKGILKALGVAIVVVGSQSEFISVIESKQVDMAVISCSSNEGHVSNTIHEIR
jgi:CheY-like chemotaxis protein